MTLTRALSCALGLLAMLKLTACEGEASRPELLELSSPRLALEQLPGTYVGSMLTAVGVEAVVLVIREVSPSRDGFTFLYQIRTSERGEDGVGTMRVGEAATQLCFAPQICGQLLVGSDQVRIAAETGPDEILPAWALEKQ